MPDHTTLHDRIAVVLAEADGWEYAKAHGLRDMSESTQQHYDRLATAVLAEIRRRRAGTLTEAEHDRAWHAIEGAAVEDGADPGIVLNAVLHALGINPPAVETHVVADDSDDPEHVDDCPGCATPTAVPARLPLVQGNCPACKQASLVLGTGGYTTCSNPDCTEPDAATTVLEQYGAEARPPQHTWRVETRDPLPGEWAPGSHFVSRPHAVERYETANSRAPRWADGTPVERRIVRETTTYTVEETQQAAAPQPDEEA